MSKQEILDSLIELAKTNKLTKRTFSHSHETPLIKTLSNEQRPTNDIVQQNWHWQHYHLPYKFGSKPPNFNDYDDLENDLATAAEPTINGTQIPGYHPQMLPLKHFDRLAQLSCDSGEMILRLNFSEPFRGIVYPNHDRLSPCRFFGDGHHNYELRLPLRGCGTRQVSY